MTSAVDTAPGMMREQATCFGCGSTAWSEVFEYNGLVLLDYMQESPLARPHYAICHVCGMVFATQRPAGDGLAFLYSRFDEFLGRTEETLEAAVGDDAAAERRLSAGWLVSEEAGVAAEDWLPEVLAFRVAEGYHADIISALVPLQGARILELRSFDGYMLQQFKGRHGAADVVAMAMSEAQRRMIERLHDVPARVIDFDEMALPDGEFDLVVARHMLTHALNPERFWESITRAVAPGGWLYLYLENDDAVMFAKLKNLFGEMKCFHFQNFDLASLARVLRFRGFTPTFIRHPKAGKSEMVCLARREPARFEPIAAEALAARRDMYAQWRALSVLSAPVAVRKRYADALDDLQRLVHDGGMVRPNRDGKLVPLKMRLMHEDGYSALNERAAAGEA
jgi:SAM-dependent methyltransferase